MRVRVKNKVGFTESRLMFRFTGEGLKNIFILILPSINP